MKSLFLLGLAAADSKVKVKENGQPIDIWLAVHGNPTVGGTYGSTIEMPHNTKAYLATSNENGAFTPTMYYAPNLLGGRIAFDVDLSQSTCSCNAALYLINMPAKSTSGGDVAGAAGDYYCDANDVGGSWCGELDIMEANQYGWHSTLHKCDAPTSTGYVASCDRAGCGQSIYQVDPTAYGPGSSYKINTLNSFHVEVAFNESGGTLTSVVYTLTQGSNSHSLTTGDSNCGAAYLEVMSGYVKSGMTMALSNWGSSQSTMAWLDSDTGCTGTCGSPDMTISNIEYTTASGSSSDSPSSSSTSVDYTYGNPCAEATDGQCGTNCSASRCCWAWPSDSTDSSPDAACRCKSLSLIQ